MPVDSRPKASPAEPAKTFIELLYDLLQFVHSRHQPVAVRQNTLSSDISGDETSLIQRLEEADCQKDLDGLSMRLSQLKWKLKQAVEAEAEVAFEAQRVQVSSPPYARIICSLVATIQPKLKHFAATHLASLGCVVLST